MKKKKSCLWESWAGFLSVWDFFPAAAAATELPTTTYLLAFCFRQAHFANENEPWDSSSFFPDVRRPVVTTAIDRERNKEKKAGIFLLVRSLCVFLPPGLARGVKRSLGFGDVG